MEQVPYGSAELEHPKTIRALVLKLSYGLQERWRQVASDKRYEGGKYLGFRDLVHFVEKAARVDSDPLFGKRAMLQASNEQLAKVTNRRRAPINAVTIENPRGKDGAAESDEEDGRDHSPKHPCICCDKEHTISSCAPFKRMDVSQRLDFVRSKGACFICLTAGHMSRNCPSHHRCGRCSRYHHTLLHIEQMGKLEAGQSRSSSYDHNKWGNSYKGGRAGSNLSSDANEFCSRALENRTGERAEREQIEESRVPISRVATGSSTAVGSMAVLPVVVRDRGGNMRETSAFLDQGSAVSFCTRGFVKKLSVGAEEIHMVNLCTETLHDVRNVSTSLVSGLRVKGSAANEWLALPPMYVVDKIPINRGDVWSGAETGRWAHFEDIEVEEVQDIDLMLGTNVMGALEPVEVRSSRSIGDPYAVRTRLGWYVIGVFKDCSKPAVVNRVAVKGGYSSSDVGTTFEETVSVSSSVKHSLLPSAGCIALLLVAMVGVIVCGLAFTAAGVDSNLAHVQVSQDCEEFPKYLWEKGRVVQSMFKGPLQELEDSLGVAYLEQVHRVRLKPSLLRLMTEIYKSQAIVSLAGVTGTPYIPSSRP